jgi:hypothetical protein
MKTMLIILFHFFIINNYLSDNIDAQRKDLKKVSEIITKKEGPAAYIVSKIFGMHPNEKAKNNFKNLIEKKSN